MATISIPAGPTAPNWAWGRVARLAIQLLSWLLLALGVAAIAFAILGPYAFGWRFAVVTSGSMEPAIRTGSIAVYSDSPPGHVSRGEIVVFHEPGGVRVMHRVASVTSDGRSVITKGDANRTADAEPLSVGAVEGQFLFSLPYLGYAANWVREPMGFGLVVGAPGAIVIMLSVISIFRLQRAPKPRSASNASADERTVMQPRPNREDENVRFPLKRNHGTTMPSRSETVHFTPVARLNESPRPAPVASVPDRPAPAPVAAAPVSAMATAIAVEPAVALKPEPPPEPLQPSPVMPNVQAGRPESVGAAIPLRGQSTAADARTERLVRNIRTEMEELKDALDHIASDRADLLEADIAAIVADPEAAASLPAPVLVRALVSAHEKNLRMTAELDRKSKLADKLKGRLRDLKVEHADLRGRTSTLQEVIAALHANLEDLRSDRDLLRRLAVPAPAALRPSLTPGALPAGPGQAVNCE